MARKFVSPGVFTQEIDQSFLSQGVANIGAGLIGLTQKGPAFAPVTVSDFNGFYANFGDVDPNLVMPYAAKNYLKNSSVLNVVRVLGSRDGKPATNGDLSTVKALVDQNDMLLAEIVVASGVAANIVGNGTDIEFSFTGGPDSVNFLGTGSMISTNSNYIGKIFNTDPTKVDIYGHYLYKNYEWAGLGGGAPYTTASLDTVATVSPFDYDFTEALSPWIQSQPFGSQLYNLFRLHTMGDGQAANTDVKVTIANITPSPVPSISEYGTFDVIVRIFSDTDKKMSQVESYSRLTLDPASPNYLPRVIGDQYVVWNSTTRKNIVHGTYKNNSKYIYVEMGSGDPPAVSLPWGHGGYSDNYVAGALSGLTGSTLWQNDANVGAILFQTIAVGSTSYSVELFSGSSESAALVGNIVHVTASNTSNTGDVVRLVNAIVGKPITASISAGSSSLISDASDFGLTAVGTKFSGTNPFAGIAPGQGFPDVPWVASNLDTQGNLAAETYFGIKLDDPGVTSRLQFTLAADSNTLATTVQGTSFSLAHVSGAFQDGLYYAEYNPAYSGTDPSAPVAGLYGQTAYDAATHGFTIAFAGGFDGWDPTQVDPLAAAGPNNSVATVALKLAVDTLSNPDEIDVNLLVLPGVIDPNVNSYARAVCNDRADCMMIMDIVNAANPKSVTAATAFVKTGGYDDNYAATYYPCLRYSDTTNNVLVTVPPSVAVLGAYAYSDRVGQVFFAPAGLNRGGLASFGIVDTVDRLTFQDRNDLYENRINPIATFPNEGIVVFGQKTLQYRPSALDRVNVRRLLIYAKKTIASVAKYLLFEPNNAATWQRFLNTVNPILEKVRQDQGIERFKVVMDTTTNTPDLIDRNIMTGKIFLQPTRTAEYIDLSFIITATGVSFEE